MCVPSETSIESTVDLRGLSPCACIADIHLKCDLGTHHSNAGTAAALRGARPLTARPSNRGLGE
jgi:hypothetical protein